MTTPAHQLVPSRTWWDCAPSSKDPLQNKRRWARRVPVTTQLLIHGKVFSGRPAFLDHSLQPSHQRSRSIHSVTFGAIRLCPDVHKCSLRRGAAASSITSGLQHVFATNSCSCEGPDALHRRRREASPTTPRCSAGWCSSYQTLRRERAGSRAVWIDAGEAPGQPVNLRSG